MEAGTILLFLGVIYFAAHALAVIFQRTGVPDVLILLIAGLAFGPVSEVASPEDFGRMGSIMTVIALAVILFESGTSLNVASVAASLKSTLLLTLLTSFSTIAVIAIGTVAFFGGDWAAAVLTGTILCGTSSAVVIPMVQSLRLSDKPATALVLESALTDVLSIVLTFAVLGSIASGEFSVAAVGREIIVTLGLAALIGIIGGFVWLQVWERIRKLPASVFTTIAFAFILYGMAELASVSGAIAALMFGLTVANLPGLLERGNLPTISRAERDFYQEIVFILKVFFFVFLGVSARFSSYAAVAASAVLVVLIYFLRIWITRISLSKEGVTCRDASVVAVMVPKGLAAAVLASLVAQKGVPQAEMIQAFVFAVVIFSIFTTAVLVPLVTQRKLARIYGLMLSRWPTGD